MWVGSEEACGAGPAQRLGSHRGQSHSGKEVGSRRGRRSPRSLPCATLRKEEFSTSSRKVEELLCAAWFCTGWGRGADGHGHPGR